MPTGDNGIAETQNRQTNLINRSPMFARRVLQSGTRPLGARGAACRCCEVRTIAMMRVCGLRKLTSVESF
jgi:hypothetical protein